MSTQNNADDHGGVQNNQLPYSLDGAERRKSGFLNRLSGFLNRLFNKCEYSPKKLQEKKLTVITLPNQKTQFYVHTEQTDKINCERFINEKFSGISLQEKQVLLSGIMTASNTLQKCASTDYKFIITKDDNQKDEKTIRILRGIDNVLQYEHVEQNTKKYTDFCNAFIQENHLSDDTNDTNRIKKELCDALSCMENGSTKCIEIGGFKFNITKDQKDGSLQYQKVLFTDEDTVLSEEVNLVPITKEDCQFDTQEFPDENVRKFCKNLMQNHRKKLFDNEKDPILPTQKKLLYDKVLSMKNNSTQRIELGTNVFIVTKSKDGTLQPPTIAPDPFQDFDYDGEDT